MGSQQEGPENDPKKSKVHAVLGERSCSVIRSKFSIVKVITCGLRSAHVRTVDQCLRGALFVNEFPSGGHTHFTSVWHLQTKHVTNVQIDKEFYQPV